MISSVSAVLRRVRRQPAGGFDRLVAGQMLSADVAGWLTRCVAAQANIVVCGAAGSGKTSMLQALCLAVPDGLQVTTVERHDMLRLGHRGGRENTVSLVATSQTSALTLVQQAWRTAPDRLAVDDIHGDEAVEVIHAFNAGLGGMCCVEAGSPAEAVDRLTMAAAWGGRLSYSAALRLTNRGVDLVVHLERVGRRGHVVEIAAVDTDGDDPRVAVLSPLWKWGAGGLCKVGEPVGTTRDKLGWLAGDDTGFGRVPMISGERGGGVR